MSERKQGWVVLGYVEFEADKTKIGSRLRNQVIHNVRILGLIPVGFNHLGIFDHGKTIARKPTIFTTREEAEEAGKKALSQFTVVPWRAEY